MNTWLESIDTIVKEDYRLMDSKWKEPHKVERSTNHKTFAILVNRFTYKYAVKDASNGETIIEDVNFLDQALNVVVKSLNKENVGWTKFNILNEKLLDPDRNDLVVVALMKFDY